MGHWMQYALAKNKRYSRLQQCIHVFVTRQSETRTMGLQNVRLLMIRAIRTARLRALGNELNEGWTELLHCRWTGLCVLLRNLTFTMSDWTLKFYFFWFHEIFDFLFRKWHSLTLIDNQLTIIICIILELLHIWSVNCLFSPDKIKIYLIFFKWGGV